MKTILVTGGTGFIGSHTCVELLQAGYNVIILDNLVNSKESSIDRIKQITDRDVKFYKTDLLDFEGTKRVFEENDIDAVIHYAGADGKKLKNQWIDDSYVGGDGKKVTSH